MKELDFPFRLSLVTVKGYSLGVSQVNSLLLNKEINSFSLDFCFMSYLGLAQFTRDKGQASGSMNILSKVIEIRRNKVKRESFFLKNEFC